MVWNWQHNGCDSKHLTTSWSPVPHFHLIVSIKWILFCQVYKHLLIASRTTFCSSHWNRITYKIHLFDEWNDKWKILTVWYLWVDERHESDSNGRRKAPGIINLSKQKNSLHTSTVLHTFIMKITSFTFAENEQYQQHSRFAVGISRDFVCLSSV